MFESRLKRIIEILWLLMIIFSLTLLFTPHSMAVFIIVFGFPPFLMLFALRLFIINKEKVRQTEKQKEKLEYKMQTYRSLENAKYEIERHSHRLMRIVEYIESEQPKNPELVEELQQIKVILKEEGYYINTGNVNFDYLISNKIKSIETFESFKTTLSLPKKDKYNQKKFINTIESLIDLYAYYPYVEMIIFESDGKVIVDLCHLGDGHPSFSEWINSHSNIFTEIFFDDYQKLHFKVTIE